MQFALLQFLYLHQVADLDMVVVQHIQVVVDPVMVEAEEAFKKNSILSYFFIIFFIALEFAYIKYNDVFVINSKSPIYSII